MFEIHDTKAFMDVVHGYINIPKLFVENIIDTKEFQRLHFVDQTGMRPVYPGAKHTRFIHSLGVYHLGLQAVDALLDNFKENVHWNIRSDNSLYVFWAKNKVLFLLACLLHDVGHAPYSHSMEKFFVEGDDNKSILYQTLSKALGLFPSGSEYIAMIKAAPHEQVSALMSIKIFHDAVGRILDSLGEIGYPQIQGYGYSEYQQKPPRIDSSDLEEDLRFIARMILGLKYADYRPEYQIRNCFIELLNGKNFDVDKLDYIIRDTKMSGISNISLDVERLINSLTIVPITNFRDFDFTEPFKASSVFLLDVIPSNSAEFALNGKIDVPLHLWEQEVALEPDTRFSMYGFSRAQDMGKTGAEVQISRHVKFSGDSHIMHLENSVYVELSPAPDTGDIMISYSPKFESYTFENAQVLNNPFDFKIIRSGAILTVEGPAKLKLTALEENGHTVLNSAHFSGEISGHVKSLRMLDDQMGDMVPTPNAYISFALGFKKQAVNIITNVMDARDYLYLWIYAHHKVVYYANYLVIELPRLAYILLHQQSATGLEELFQYNSFTADCLDEPSLLALIREANKEHCRWKTKGGKSEGKEQKIHQRFEILYEEFFSRRYKKSVYKSLAEYDLFFHDFTTEEKIKLRQLLPKETSIDPTAKYVSDPKYGTWDQDMLEKNQITTLEWLVWVDPSYNRKMLDMSKVYICFQQDVLNVERIPIIRKEHGDIQNFMNYFYLYYRPKQSVKPSDVERELKAYLSKLAKSI